MDLAASVLNPDHIVQAGGILLVSFIIFAETGLLIGFFLPGDTLLIAAGVWAAGHHHSFPLWAVLPAVAIAAILGYELGYKIGRTAGPHLFKRKDGLFFRADYITRTQKFFSKHGGKSILLARFIAVVRTVVPIVAGAGKMDRRFFHVYNVIGGILWTFAVTLTAYWIGTRVPNLDRYLIWLLIFAMVATVGSLFAGAMRTKQSRTAFRQALLEEFNYFFRRG